MNSEHRVEDRRQVVDAQIVNYCEGKSPSEVQIRSFLNYPQDWSFKDGSPPERIQYLPGTDKEIIGKIEQEYESQSMDFGKRCAEAFALTDESLCNGAESGKWNRLDFDRVNERLKLVTLKDDFVQWYFKFNQKNPEPVASPSSSKPTHWAKRDSKSDETGSLHEQDELLPEGI